MINETFAIAAVYKFYYLLASVHMKRGDSAATCMKSSYERVLNGGRWIWPYGWKPLEGTFILHLWSFCWCSRGETIDWAGIRLSSMVQKPLIYHRISSGYQIFACTTREFCRVLLPNLIANIHKFNIYFNKKYCCRETARRFLFFSSFLFFLLWK